MPNKLTYLITMSLHPPSGEEAAVAYLVNRYPLPSHSFIKREILAVEGAGLRVSRFSIRPTDVELPDPGDRAELEHTRAILAVGPLGLALALLRVAVSRPGRFLGATRCVIGLARNAGRRYLAHLAWLAEACVLERWVREGGIGHIHAHFATNSTAVAMLAGRLAGVSYSFAVHGPDDFDRARFLSFPRKVRDAAFVTAISDFCRGQIWRWSDPADWEKVRILRCGLDRAFLDEPRSDPPDVPRLVTVGRLSAAKGQSLLVDAVAELTRQGVEVELVLVGGGDQREALEERARAAGIADRLQFTGFASGAEVRSWMLSSRAFVSASFAEGLPVVVMEAFALRRPVVATRIAAMAELVRDGENGWLVSSGSRDELVEALRAVLKTPVPRLAEMAAHGYEQVAQRHDADLEGQRLAGWFRDQLRVGASSG